MTTPAGAEAASRRTEIALPDEAAGAALAHEISLYLRPGDLILLGGDLGAGKTHFARALIRSIAGEPALEVPSPTFTLRQDYVTPRFAIAHLDLYRIGDPAEAGELDVEGALGEGAALVEWPEKAGGALENHPDRLEIGFAFAPGGGRIATLAGHGSWAERLERREAVNSFLRDSGHGGDTRGFLQGDASPRRYERLSGADGNLVLMDSPARPDPGKDPAKAYSRVARLAEDVTPFVAIAAGLERAGLRAPHIHHRDMKAGLLILDDLGGGRITGPAGEPLPERYHAAMEALVHLHRAGLSETTEDYTLPAYSPETFLAETALACQWFAPWRHGGELPDEAQDELRDAFSAALAPVIADAEKSWTLRDYHSPNIIWIGEAEGLARVGIIDFQDALYGPAAYDVASLAMDARVDIGEALERELVDAYVTARAGDRGFDEARFRRDYAVMAAQRNTKIVGIFARLAMRDGKTGYLQHQPRIATYLARALSHPHLAEVRRWFETRLPEAIDPQRVLKT
ncbi:MAG: tRNA (adenosine(37)-N6)-threonylcarbamoyltransferase complex ATPase subunit type 1 TsaE [Flavobacteriaceae bacterium]